MSFDYRFGCNNKIKYFSQGEALAEIKRFLDKKRNNQRVYACRFIEEDKRHWHITSMSRAEFKRRNFKKPKLQSLSQPPPEE